METAVNLYTREFGGQGVPVAILHGLFASSKNWIGTAQYLSGFSRPFALDLRHRHRGGDRFFGQLGLPLGDGAGRGRV